MNLHILSYCIYLPITTLLTVWVGRNLFSNGKVFLLDIFDQNETLAESVNQLLLVGFYLINIGYVVYTLSINLAIPDYRVLMEALSKKIGLIILILGGMHFFNLLIFYKIRKKHLYDQRMAKMYK